MSSNGLSIIVTAYKTHDFISNCMTSIADVFSRYAQPYEVLIGVDGCRRTLDVLRQTKLPHNSKVFWFRQNVGTYVVSNTLITKKTYNKVIRFDSDDIMKPPILSYLDDRLSPLGCVYKIPCYNFYVKDQVVYFKGADNRDFAHNSQGVPAVEHAAGVVIYDDKVLGTLGGYKPWRCAADTDFTNRAHRAGIAIKKLDPKLGPAFYRRRHSGSLTGSPATGGNSELRRGYKLEAKRDRTVYVTPVVTACELVL